MDIELKSNQNLQHFLPSSCFYFSVLSKFSSDSSYLLRDFVQGGFFKRVSEYLDGVHRLVFGLPTQRAASVILSPHAALRQ